MFAAFIRTVITLFTAINLIACTDETKPPAASISIPKFSLPPDGRLTEEQVASYISIRHQINREVKARDKEDMIALLEGVENVEATTERRYFDEIEKAVANASGMSYDEYLWIKDTIIATRTSLWLQQYYEANNKIVNLLDKTLTGYKQAAGDKKDSEEQKLMEAHVKEMKQELSGLRDKINYQNKNSEAYTHNSGIISRYSQALESIEAQTE